MNLIDVKGHRAIHLAVDLLKKGNIIAFPTDSVYGLCGIYNTEVASLMHSIRRRPFDKPFILAIPEKYLLSNFSEKALEPEQEKFINQQWPGKTTVIIHKNIQLNYPHGTTIALRKPSYQDNPYFHSLLQVLDLPLLVPSLNLPGEKPLERPEEITTQFGEYINHIFFEKTYISTHVSSVWDLTCQPFKVLR